MSDGIHSIMERLGFFEGDFEDLGEIIIKGFFSEQGFKTIGLDEEDMIRTAIEFRERRPLTEGERENLAELAEAHGIHGRESIDWESIREAAWDVLQSMIICYILNDEQCSLTYRADELMEWNDLHEDESGETPLEDLRQFWNVEGVFAKSRESWEMCLEWAGIKEGSDEWKLAEGELSRFHLHVDGDLLPVSCHVQYVRGGDWNLDPHDTIEGSGSYLIF